MKKISTNQIVSLKKNLQIIVAAAVKWVQLNFTLKIKIGVLKQISRKGILGGSGMKQKIKNIDFLFF